MERIKMRLSSKYGPGHHLGDLLEAELRAALEKAAEAEDKAADFEQLWNRDRDEVAKAEAEADALREHGQRLYDENTALHAEIQRQTQEVANTRAEADALRVALRDRLDSCSLPGGDREIDSFGIAVGPHDCAMCDEHRRLLDPDPS